MQSRKRNNYLKVKSIEVNEKHVSLRIFLFFVFLSIAIFAIGYGIYSLGNKKEGWHQFKTENVNDESSIFTLYYYISGNSKQRKTQYITIRQAFISMMNTYEKMFDGSNTYNDVRSVGYINQHPNEEIEISSDLYDAFSKFSTYSDNRLIYYYPVLDAYQNLFNLEDQSVYANDNDPNFNSSLRDYIDDVCLYCNDSNFINIVLLGNNKVKLSVSDQYISFCNSNEIEQYIDFSYIKNAFIVDLVRKSFINNGYNNGYVLSGDGFYSLFTTKNISLRISHLLYDQLVVEDIASVSLSGNKSIVLLSPFYKNYYGKQYFIYNRENIVTTYIDKDGKSISLMDYYTFYSNNENNGCVDIVLKSLPLFMKTSLDLNEVDNLKQDNISIIYVDNQTIKYNDGYAIFTIINTNYSKGQI